MKKGQSSVFVLSFLAIVAVTCQKNKESIEEPSLKKGEVLSMHDLGVQVITKGDTNAYKKLVLRYTKGPTGGCLMYSLIMANRYDYTPAYYNVYCDLYDIHIFNGIFQHEIDSSTQEMIFHYMRIGASKGDQRAINFLNKHPGGVIKEGEDYN